MTAIVRPWCSMAVSWAARSMPAASPDTTVKSSLTSSRVRRRVRARPSGRRDCGCRRRQRTGTPQDPTSPGSRGTQSGGSHLVASRGTRRRRERVLRSGRSVPRRTAAARMSRILPRRPGGNEIGRNAAGCARRTASRATGMSCADRTTEPRRHPSPGTGRRRALRTPPRREGAASSASLQPAERLDSPPR